MAKLKAENDVNNIDTKVSKTSKNTKTTKTSKSTNKAKKEKSSLSLEEVLAKRKELLGEINSESEKAKEILDTDINKAEENGNNGNNNRNSISNDNTNDIDGTNIIRLSEVIETTKKFINGEISKDEMAEYGNKFSIRSYLPIIDKMSIMMAITSQHLYSITETMEIKIIELYKNIFFYVLMSAYCQIDCTNRDDITYENYDLLYPIFAPFILTYCRDDFNLFMEMLRENFNFYNIKELSEAVNNIDTLTIEESVKSNNELMKNLEKNKDLIKDLKDISNMNDPYTKLVVDELKKVSLRDINNQLKK